MTGKQFSLVMGGYVAVVMLVAVGVASTNGPRAADSEELLNDAWWACFKNSHTELSADGTNIIRTYSPGFEACPGIVAEHERREKAQEAERRARDLDAIRALTGVDQ